MAVGLAVAACGGDSTAPQDSVYARYTLNTIDGRRVPTIFQETASGRLEFLSGALRLKEDGTFTDSTEIRVTPMFHGEPLQGGEVIHRYDVAWGLHRLSGDTVYLSSVRGEQYFMVVQASGSLSQELAAAVLTYRR
jgi:hypothetical protein